MVRSSFSAAASLFVLLIATESAWSQCEPVWSRQFAPSWPAGDVLAAVNFDDDGDGPHREAVILAGKFLSAGDVPANHIVKWDGTWWSPLGSGIGDSSNASITMRGMVVFDEDGPGPAHEHLWVLGNFPTTSGGLGNGFARWNGVEWTYVPCPDSGTPVRMVVGPADGELPGLYLSIQNTTLVASVWRFSGGTWTKLGESLTGYNSAVSALHFYDVDGPGPALQRLVVAGTLFGTTSGTTLSRIAQWNGQTWERLGAEAFTNSISFLEEYDPDGRGPGPVLLIAAMQSSEDPACNCVHAWNGSDWNDIGTLSASSSGIAAFSMKVFDPDGDGPLRPRLYVAGVFDSINGQFSNARGMAWWDGANWHSANWPNTNASWLFPIRWPTGTRTESKLLSCANGSYGKNSLGDGAAWLTVPRPFTINQARGPDPDHRSNDPLGSELIAAGVFYFGSDNTPYSAARWDGYEWHPLGGRSGIGGATFIARADSDGLGPLPPTVMMLGWFQFPGMTPAVTNIAQLIDGTWQPAPQVLPGYPPTHIMMLESLDTDGPGPLPSQIFYAGLMPDMVHPHYGVVRWTGAAWDPLPGQFNSQPTCMAVHDEDGDGPNPPRIFVGGVKVVDGVPMNGIARWDGQHWSQLVNSLTGTVGCGSLDLYPDALCSFDPDGSGPGRPVLYAGGSYFGSTDGANVNRIGRWDGTKWSAMGSGFGASVSSIIAMDDDGAGPHSSTIFVGGILKSYGVPHIKGFARWNGLTWDPVGPDVLGLYSYPSQILAMPTNNDWSQAPALWGFGSFQLDNNPNRQPVVRWGVPSPYFHAWPKSQTATSGGAVAMRVAAGGAEPLGYQWRRNGVPLFDGGGISGSATSELVITSFSNQDAGQYDCVVANACGSATSPPAEVNACPGAATPDMNGDGVIDGRDIQPFVEQFLSAAASVSSICQVDLNGNHAADAMDATMLVQSLLAN